MSLLSETYTLYNGVKIPKIGFGTWQISNAAAYDAVSVALKTGYRHIDTARAYGNEENVGKAVRDCTDGQPDLHLHRAYPGCPYGLLPATEHPGGSLFSACHRAHSEKRNHPEGSKAIQYIWCADLPPLSVAERSAATSQVNARQPDR